MMNIEIWISKPMCPRVYTKSLCYVPFIATSFSTNILFLPHRCTTICFATDRHVFDSSEIVLLYNASVMGIPYPAASISLALWDNRQQQQVPLGFQGDVSNHFIPLLQVPLGFQRGCQRPLFSIVALNKALQL